MREQNRQRKRLPVWVPALVQPTGVFQSVSTLVEKIQNTKMWRTPELQAGILLCLLDLGCSPSQVCNEPVCHEQICSQNFCSRQGSLGQKMLSCLSRVPSSVTPFQPSVCCHGNSLILQALETIPGIAQMKYFPLVCYNLSASYIIYSKILTPIFLKHKIFK